MSAAFTAEQFVQYLIIPQQLFSVSKHSKLDNFFSVAKYSTYYESKYTNRTNMYNCNFQNAFENTSAEEQFWKSNVE